MASRNRVTGPSGWLDGDKSKWPLTDEAVAKSLGLPLDLVKDILNAHEVAMAEALRRDAVIAAGNIVVSVGGDDPLAEFIARTSYNLDLPEFRDEDHPAHHEFDLLAQDRELVIRSQLVDAVYERVNVLASHDVADEVVRAYWSMRDQAMEAGFKKPTVPLGRDMLEVDLEDWLVDHLDAIADFDLNISLWSTADVPTAGRQYTLPNGRRPDLICVDDQGDPVVLELKTSIGDAESVKQLVDYLGPVAEVFGRPAEECRGVLIADGTVEVARTLIAEDDRLSYILVRDIAGYEQIPQRGSTGVARRIENR